MLAEVYRSYFITDKIDGRDGAIPLAGLQRALNDVAPDGDVFKVAPRVHDVVLDPSLRAILA